MNVKIGTKIKVLRKRDGVTQEKLADALCVTPQAVSKWESETGYPDLEYLMPIANFFNITIDELFGHDLAKKQRKIDEYCKQYDDLARDWSDPGTRVELMRQALAEFPANEQLLFRLASALWYQWNKDVGKNGEIYIEVDGMVRRDPIKVKAVKGWEEPVKIFSDLLATSINDEIRFESTQLLIYLYSYIGEKERACELAEHYPDSRDRLLCTAFAPSYPEESAMYSQRLLVDGLHNLTNQMPNHAKNSELKAETYEKLFDLYKFLFRGDYGFYSAFVCSMYIDYAEILLDKQKDDAFAALEKAYEYADAFDRHLDEIRSQGVTGYTSPFTCLLKDESEKIYASKYLPQFLNCVLKDKKDDFYKKLHDDPRYMTLVARIEKEVADEGD